MDENEAPPDYSSEAPVVSEEAMAKLHRLIAEQAKLELELLELETKTATLKAKVGLYKEKLVPEVMMSLGLDELKTKTGLKVKLREEVYASFPQDPEKQARAFEYLRRTGNDGLIKREITVNYGRDSTKFADELLLKLEELKVGEHGTVDHKWTIHPSTLSAFIRAQLREGEPIDIADFGAHQAKFAEFEFKKDRKKNSPRQPTISGNKEGKEE